MKEQILGKRKPCCRRPENMKLLQLEPFKVERCVKCGCRHFTAKAEPGQIFSQGTPLGKSRPFGG